MHPGAKTIKKNTNSTQNKPQTHRAKQYEVTSFLSTGSELSTETCSKNVYSLGPWCKSLMSLKHPEMLELSGKRFSVLSTEIYERQCGCQEACLPTNHCQTESAC